MVNLNGDRSLFSIKCYKTRMASFRECKVLSDSDIGQYFTDFKLLGSGNFGTVSAATVTTAARKQIGADLPKKVAVKELKISINNASDIALLINEVTTLKQLDIPHAIKYYGCFHDIHADEIPTNGEGGPGVLHVSLIMDLLEGKDLFDMINEAALSHADKIEIMVQLAQGIADLHAKGIVHRDIKPENTFITRRSDGKLHVVLIDYGLVCNSRAPVGNSCNAVSGTPGYVDPYIMSGTSALLDDKARMRLFLADWWSYGQTIATLYQVFNLYDDDTGEYIPVRAGDFANGGMPRSVIPMFEALTNPSLTQAKRPTPEQILQTISSLTVAQIAPFMATRRNGMTTFMEPATEAAASPPIPPLPPRRKITPPLPLPPRRKITPPLPPRRKITPPPPTPPRRNLVSQQPPAPPVPPRRNHAPVVRELAPHWNPFDLSSPPALPPPRRNKAESASVADTVYEVPSPVIPRKPSITRRVSKSKAASGRQASPLLRTIAQGRDSLHG